MTRRREVRFNNRDQFFFLEQYSREGTLGLTRS